MLRHKWFVFIAARKVHCPLWLAIIHDWHKFLPSEWFPYAHAFYNTDGTKRYEETQAFNMAWNHHQKRGKHHWQYWLLTYDRGETQAIDMPTEYILEMIADWWGAGKGQSGNWDAVTWYEKNKDRINISPVTRRILERNLYESEAKFLTPKLLAKRRAIIGY